MSTNMSHILNHIAISVPDAEAAANWYVEVLGFHVLRQMTKVDRAVTPEGAIFKIFPPDLNKVRTAFLSSGNGIGLELFEFQDPMITSGTEANFERDYKRGGLFHFAITSPDIEALCAKVVKHGGKTVGEKVPIYEYEALYVEDPWGNVIELLSVSFERLMSNR